MQNYVQQLMWNNPPGMSPAMDLAKMLAKLELVESLQTDGFKVWRECRSGLTSFPADPDRAKGHLAASTLMQMAVRPHIIHVVAFCEADHAATADDVIEWLPHCAGRRHTRAAGPARHGRRPGGAAAQAGADRRGHPAAGGHPASGRPDVADPFTHAPTLDAAVRLGLMDAPHLMGNQAACGEVTTGFPGGACVAVDRRTRRPLTEAERIGQVWKRAEKRQVEMTGD